MKKNDSHFLSSIIEQNDSFMTERFRAIMTNLQFMKTKKHETIKTIVLTSSHKSEGKSFCALNLAVSFARQNKKVLLVDADMHKPKLTGQFGLRYAEGLSTVLNNSDEPLEQVVETEEQSLYFLPAGLIPPNPLELINTERMKEIISIYEETFDIVIFDTPPVLIMNDSRILGSFCDGVILVVRNGRTKQRDIETAKELLERTEGHLIGAILNGKKYAAKELKTYSYY
ncbi:CpsD/CapB family tyrosine-protein kinase [Listeria seeligeri]|uniref:CpsD/CapB family tyrosine-protein kinase n=1 Tax=Listeria seeligeri TaxID=1640 RepID=UPI001623A634|nr:CpsD/CapB family tyrosine-protein kinase [Listeria seeligeri]MBC1826618.1 CpsD/CapB family tyrosine-protein kinase [Listeria seeligeri]MBC1870022.1 CpsD/CapB family tyrosine-protein kinase [Listeria seeligeri]MBM5606503.1 polysaccharide biosynthesis tyrosine autokinase [Listeria seeligeri]MBM5677967.1 polysaccharide biosynthesis tyrosine autokinase [Listeria seeligeri]